jgi:DNA mismatch repair protein MutS2
MIEQHTLDTLEYPKVKAIIAGKTLTPFGKEEVAAWEPVNDLTIIRQRQTEISQMKDIVQFGDPFPMSRLEDCRDLLSKSQIPGIFLDAKEIFSVLELLEVSIDLHNFDKDGRSKYPVLREYIEGLRAYPELVRDIKKAIDEKGDIKDDASPKLRQVRYELIESKRKIIRSLDSILGAQSKKPGWQDDVVTQRNGRYVIPVPADGFRHDLGILHDRSQSGATFYVEPKETVELNNRLNMLFQEERVEMDRILRALTVGIASRVDDLEKNIYLIGKLDSFYAAAKFGAQIKANQPEMVETASFKLIDARHPLLLAHVGSLEKVVPMTMGLDADRQAVVVTGPNTGGKTIVLKTIGLLQLMAQTGLLIPAGERSEVGLFEKVFADIGDEQSIELSLSTFSSHISNIIHAVKNCDDRTLILFDEIGAGTDPKEGSALAEAIILSLVERGARLVATTHYSQLKSLPLQHPAIENASLEFDRETLAPTYRLRLGIPGSSYAVEIAGRLGMPDGITNHASTLLGSGERTLADLIASMEAELIKVKDDRASLTARLEQVKEMEQQYKERTEKFDTEMQQEREKALAETETLLNNARKETERLVAEIRKTQADKDSVKKMHKLLKTAETDLTSIKAKTTEAKQKGIEAIRFMKGDAVRLAALNKEGVIESLIGDDRAKVRIGNVRTIVELRGLRRVDLPTKEFELKPVGSVHPDEQISPEIHLRGMTGEEAQEALDRYLDRAIVAGLTQVYVVHGKGTGALRRTLTEYLKKHRDVDSLRLGDWNEGGAGVTIVKLKQ